MRITISWAIGIAVGLGSIAAHAANVVITPDRMAEVDGKRVFILGLYDNPTDDAILQQVKDAGFNLVTSGPDLKALDRLQAHGLWAWINTGATIDLSDEGEARAAQLAGLAGNFGAHPALLAWEVPDEALWNCWYGPQGWRMGEEPAQLSALIKAVPDPAQAANLSKQLDQARALYREAKYAQGEQIADSIWTQLGKTPPKPGYGLSTSADRAVKMCTGMIEGYKKLRAADPAHPIWMNHAPRNQIAQLAAFNQAADIVGCDIYPVPFSPKVGHSDLAEKTLVAVGAYTSRMQESAPGKPIWMVLQGFGWGDIQPGLSDADRKELRRPTREETRFMAYDAIVRGARGLLYWGSAYVEKDSPFWADLLSVIGELRDQQPLLSAPDSDASITIVLDQTYGSVDRGLRVLAKQVDGQLRLLLVNEWTDPLSYTLMGLKNMEKSVFVDSVSGEKMVVEAEAIRGSIPRHGIQILSAE